MPVAGWSPGDAQPAVELADLRLFVVLAEELHFGRAAARLHLSQPGLSYRVKALEQALGYQVLARNRRGVRLTPAGEAVLGGACRLLGEAHRAGLDLAGSAQFLTGLPVTSPAAARALSVMASGDFSPNFPVRLVAKDLRYVTAVAAQLGGQAPMARAALAGYEQASAAGHASEDLHAIAALY
jgi:DNA-binding transcriptional LysR family regulator